MKTRKVKSGIYTFDLQKVGGVVGTVAVTLPTGHVVAHGSGPTVREAIERIAKTTLDAGLRMTINQTVFPDF